MNTIPESFESHLIAIKESGMLMMVNVEEHSDVLVFINTTIGPNAVDPCYVCSLPNRYGHAGFKCSVLHYSVRSNSRHSCCFKAAKKYEN